MAVAILAQEYFLTYFLSHSFRFTPVYFRRFLAFMAAAAGKKWRRGGARRRKPPPSPEGGACPVVASYLQRQATAGYRTHEIAEVARGITFFRGGSCLALRELNVVDKAFFDHCSLAYYLWPKAIPRWDWKPDLYRWRSRLRYAWLKTRISMRRYLRRLSRCRSHLYSEWHNDSWPRRCSWNIELRKGCDFHFVYNDLQKLVCKHTHTHTGHTHLPNLRT